VDPEPIVFDSTAGESVVLATLPWISQRYIVKATQLMELDGFDMNTLFRDRLKGVIDKVCEPFRDDAINLVAGHVTIAGGAMGGGERTAQTIFDYWIDATSFPSNAHYVGLGHLHKMQKMPGPCPIHYCGAPLHLDFSDDEGDNFVLIVEARPRVPATVEEVALASGRRLRTLRGTMKQLEALGGTTGDDHLRVIVEGTAHTGLGDEIRELFPSAVKVIVEPKVRDGTTPEAPSREGLSPTELFARFLGEKDIEDPALLKLFSELYEECA
jgi:exonuclease SbcD